MLNRLTVLVAALTLLGLPTSVSAAPSISTVRAVDGVNLLVAEEGDRASPGILFIHGFAQSYLSFRKQFGSDLTKRFHLVAFDLRGHGGSSKPDDPAAYSDIGRSADDVAAVIKATGLVRPVIVGWSYGGLVVGDYVRKYGTADVAGVVFAGTLGGLANVPPPPAPKLSAVLTSMHSASDLTRSSDLEANIEGGRIISDAYATPAMTDEDRRILFATEMMLPAYVRRAMTKRPSDNSDLVARLAGTPMLLVRGGTELGMPETAMAALAARLPRMSVSRYPAAGHLTFFEAPDRFNAELARFVDAASASPVPRGDPAAGIPRPGLPMSLAAHRAFRDREFAVTDRNGDGQIDMAELKFRMEAALGRSSPEALARAMRVNCGTERPACTRAAFRAQGDAEFSHVDADGDHIVTEAELRAAGGTFHREQPY